MIRAIAIDDEPSALMVLETFCAEMETIQLLRSFTKVNEALAYLQMHPIDLVFLDIRMPAMNGIRLAKEIIGHKAMIVFTTAYSDYAVESYEVRAIDYLMKPISRKRFAQSMEKAQEIYALTQTPEEAPAKEIYIRANNSSVCVSLTDIAYIEGLADYLKIHFQHNKPLVTRMTMKEMSETLPSDSFIRVHRSFIISKSKIVALKAKSVVLESREIPIGVTYLQDIKEWLDSKQKSH